MRPKLNLLVVEDSPDDAALLIEKLESAGFDPLWRRVEQESDFRAHLSPEVQLIICDFTLPQFSPIRALDILREGRWDIPIIVISGTIGEERAVEILKLGATDYLLKDRLQRIGQVVERALADAVLRKERRRLEEQLRLQAAALEYTASAVAITDLSGKFIWVNPAFSKLTGYSLEEVAGRNPRILKSGKHPRAMYQELWDTILAGRTWQGELTNRRKDGTLYFGEQTITPVRSATGELTHFVGIMNDITARKIAEDKLRDTNEKLSYLLAHNPAIFYALKIQSGQLVPLLVSETVTQLLGFTIEEALNPEWWFSHVHPEDRPRIRQHEEETLSAGHSRFEYRFENKDGSYRWIEDNQRLIRDNAGKPKEVAGVWVDVTARKELEREVVRREQQLNSFFTGATAGLAVLDARLRFVQVNGTLAEMNGIPVHQHIGRNIAEVLPQLSSVLGPLLQRVLETGLPILNTELSGEVPSQPGVVREWLASYFPVKAEDGSVEGVGAIVVEQTERKRAEAALKSSEEKFRQLAESINDVFWISSADLSQTVYVSPAIERIWGHPVSEFYRRPRLWSDAIVAEDRPVVLQKFESLMRGTPITDLEYRITTPEGAVKWISDRGFPVRNDKGEVYRLVGVATEITDKKKLESQLLRAQRLESIGTLAGGIAHDLNNALSPILMSIEILRTEVTNSQNAFTLELIATSAQRGADMVKQLLTFSRGVEGQHTAVEMKHLVREMQSIIRQTFPKNIQSRVELPKDLWAVVGDVTQLHQVLLNLCVNARDAMPHGGTLTIKLSNLMIDEHFAEMRVGAKPGPHVVLSVQDSGTGMPPEVVERIFEPFFTTKPINVGTGLGLSTVQGIVKSHGGLVTVYSELGKGSEFHVYLPAQQSGVSDGANKANLELPRGNGELVLVVDDEAAIRHMIQRTLEAYGYEVCTAGDGAHAVAICAQRANEIAVMLTDMAMPVMDGLATMRAVKTIAPRLKIIAASGLQDDPRSLRMEAAEAKAFLHKPFTAEKLLTTLRQVLEAK